MTWSAQDPRFQIAVKVAATWVSKHPELKGRLERAVFLVEDVRPSDCESVYTVASSTGRGVYTVRVDRVNRESSCNCPDSQTGHHCKHRLAVALYDRVSARYSGSDGKR